MILVFLLDSYERWRFKKDLEKWHSTFLINWVTSVEDVPPVTRYIIKDQ